jgi:small subunit ribosomal protein S18
MQSKKRRSSGTDKRKRKACPFKKANISYVDYKDVDTLNKFITERGKILPRRITGLSAFFHRKVVEAIKQARYIALMPFVTQD